MTPSRRTSRTRSLRALATAALLAVALVAGNSGSVSASQWRWHDGYADAADARDASDGPARDAFVASFASQPTDALVAQLASAEWTRRSAASIALARRGAPVVATLLPSTCASDPLIRAGVAATFARMGVPAAAAGPALVPLLRDDRPYVRYHAVRGLGAVTPSAAVGALVSAPGRGLDDPDEVVRRAAADGLSAVGADAVPALRRQVVAGTAAARGGAATALGRIGDPAASAVEDLVAVLRSDAPGDVRVAAAGALGALRAAAALPALVERLHDRREPGVALAAARALAEFGPAAAPVAADLVREYVLLVADGTASGDAFRDLYPAVGDAVRALGDAAAPALGDALVSDAPNGPGQAVQALRDVGDAAIPQLARGVRPADGRMRTGAVEALESMGPRAAAAVPDLVRALAEEDDWQRLCAAKALAAIDPAQPGILPVLSQALEDLDPDHRWFEEAAEAAGRLGPRAASLVPKLRAALARPDPDRSFVRPALAALVRVAPESRAEVAALLVSGPEAERWAAYSALSDLGPDAAPCVTVVLGDGQLGVQAAAALAGWGAPSVEPVRRALDDARPHVRRAAATLLARLGPAATAAFLDAAGRSDPAVREGALLGLSSTDEPIRAWERLFPPGAARETDEARSALETAFRDLVSRQRAGAASPTSLLLDVLAFSWPDRWVRADLAASAAANSRRGIWADVDALCEEIVARGGAAVPDLVHALDAPETPRRLAALAVLDVIVRPVRAPLPTARRYRMVDPRARGARRPPDDAAAIARRDLVPAIRRLVRDANPEIALAAAATLAAFEPLGADDAAPLVAAILGRAAEPRSDTGGEESPDWLDDQLRFEAAMDALRDVRPEALAPLVPVLRGEPGPARVRALRALAEIDATPAGVVEALRAVVAGGPPSERVHAARALVRRGGDPAELAPVLAAGLDSRNALVERSALDGLARCGAAAAPYAGAVLDGMTADRNGWRDLTDHVRALVAAGPAAAAHAERIVAVVRRARRDMDDIPSLAALLRAAVADRAVRVPMLLDLAPTDAAVADEIADALAAEGPDILLACAVAMDQRDPPVGGAALLACARLGPAAAPLLDRIAAPLLDGSGSSRDARLLLHTVGRIGPDAWRVLLRLQRELDARTARRAGPWVRRRTFGATYGVAEADTDTLRRAIDRILGW